MSPQNSICLSVSVSVCLLQLISQTMGHILIKLEGSVRTWSDCIMHALYYHENRFSDDIITTLFLIFFSLFFFAKGQNSAAKKYPSYNCLSRFQNRVEDKCIARALKWWDKFSKCRLDAQRRMQELRKCKRGETSVVSIGTSNKTYSRHTQRQISLEDPQSPRLWLKTQR